MAITREEAYRVLELHRDATGEEIRASYKRLALRWHPDKHNNSQEATKKFQEVSSAYKRLTSTESDDEIHLTRADMFDIFTHVFFHRNGMFDFNRYNPYESDEDYSDEDEDDMEDELLHGIASRLRNKYDRSKTANYSKTNGKPAHNLSEAEALKNAEELIKEEERDRKKAEKRRQKKKRNKERKKQKEKEKKDQNDEKENKKENDREKTNIQFEKLNLKETQNMNNKPPQNVKTSKLNQSPTSGVKEKSQNISSSNKKEQQKLKGNKSRNQVNGETDSDEDEPDWDQSSAFFTRAAGRNPSSNPSNSAPSTLKDTSKTNTTSSSNTADTQSNKNNNEKEPVTEQLDPVVLQSRQLAVRGNEMANLGNYAAAIDLFTQAIKLDARDFRFFGNRSYCYDRLGQYEKALQDADVAISLAPDWPKGYFRRGRALAGIKLFSDSEVAFAQVLKLDKYCEDAMFELARVRVQQLEDMGFPTTQSEAAIRSYGTVQAALEALLAGKVQCPSTEEIYQSDDEEEEKIRVAQHIAPVEQNISGCKSVWVGNVNAEIVSESELQQIFSQCGKIESVKVLPTRYCAFINYSTPEAAARAISVLQGFQLGGQNLLLRYPNNSGIPAALQPQVNESLAKTKLTGPVNGDECYFWRTTGCSFGDRCRNRHLPENKGIDLKKVEAKYGGRI